MNARARLWEQTASLGLGAALVALVEAPVVVNPARPERLHPDIVIGRAGAVSIADVIEIKRGKHESMKRAIDDGLAQLEAYLQAARAVHGALVLLDALSRDAIEPQIEHVKTPAGRDVLLVRL
jgi:hypothetical protein